MRSPDFEPIYYATLQRLLNTTFSKPQFDSTVDATLGGYVTTANINSIKTWMDGRRSFVQNAINGLVPPTTNNPAATIANVPRSPSPLPSPLLSPVVVSGVVVAVGSPGAPGSPGAAGPPGVPGAPPPPGPRPPIYDQAMEELAITEGESVPFGDLQKY